MHLMFLCKIITYVLTVSSSTDDGNMVVADQTDAILLWISLICPIILLLIFSLIKYAVGIFRENIQWHRMFAEIPIDLLSIFSALILSRYFIADQSLLLIISACSLILLSILFAIGACIARTWIHNRLDWSSPPYCKIAISTVAMYIFTLGWLIVIFRFPIWIQLL